MSKTQIMKHVDILDLIRINVFRILNTSRFEVDIQCVDKSKDVVFDEGALSVLNRRVTEKASQLNADDPRVNPYIAEFVGRMISELYKNGLVELEEIKEQKSDPYQDLRRIYNGRRKD